ncbi:MAG: DUF503 domain-containing protein [Deltaproteobacteria bacterium]|nr:DUF503 domain-containing protein [Deltaproteobacteria bacterium]MBI3294396.1 DUF503 domain-containing protein [Deltaproteobacteria bacterium]
MYSLHTAICHVAMRLRGARSLKDKRQITQSIVSRLRNLGFSVCECGAQDDFKTAHIGFSFAGHSSQTVARVVDEGMRLFVGEFEVVKRDREIIQHAPTDSDDLSWMAGIEGDLKD